MADVVLWGRNPTPPEPYGTLRAVAAVMPNGDTINSFLVAQREGDGWKLTNLAFEDDPLRFTAGTVEMMADQPEGYWRVRFLDVAEEPRG